MAIGLEREIVSTFPPLINPPTYAAEAIIFSEVQNIRKYADSQILNIGRKKRSLRSWFGNRRRGRGKPRPRKPRGHLHKAPRGPLFKASRGPLRRPPRGPPRRPRGPPRRPRGPPRRPRIPRRHRGPGRKHQRRGPPRFVLGIHGYA